MLELTKTLAMLVMPVGLAWLALLAGAALQARRRRWRSALALGAAWVLLGGFGNLYLGSALLARLERGVPVPDLARLEPFDAVLVLGGGAELDPAGQPMLTSTGDRVALAARLWHAGKARVLVASGVTLGPGGEVRDSGQSTRDLWISLGVPAAAIEVVPEPCWITREEIAAYRGLCARRDWRLVGLVSSAWHLPRALALARRAGLRVEPLGCNWNGQRQAFRWHWLVPQGEGLRRSQDACWEYLGRWVGR